jgi:FMN phosphatase YigB (HAD superfamily)
MIRLISFDLGHTLLDEVVGREIDIRFRPAVPMPGVLEVLPRIALPMSVWANTRAATVVDIKPGLGRAGLDRYFTRIITSSEAGYRKPDQKFFSYALKECGCSAGEVLFIGNQLNTDIKGANASGIRSIFLSGSDYRSPDDDGDPTANPTYMIGHLGELPDLLTAICR